MQKKLSLMKKKIKKWIKENKVVDVILFGSLKRGKSKPNDIDLCILINDIDENKSLDLVDSLNKLTNKLKINTHINILTLSNFILGDTLTKTLIIEGFSIRNNKDYCNVINFASKSLFIYNLKKFSSSKRVRFHYLLKGRYGRIGLLKETKGEFVGSATIMVPVDKEDVLKEVFDTWKVDYKISRILLG